MHSFKVKYYNSAFSIRAVNGTKKVVCILYPLYFTAEEYMRTNMKDVAHDSFGGIVCRAFRLYRVRKLGSL